MDGTYVYPAPCKANKRTDYLDYRLKKNHPPNKRCVIAVREHFSADEKAESDLNRGA